jgi:hypothetical protein
MGSNLDGDFFFVIFDDFDVDEAWNISFHLTPVGDLSGDNVVEEHV